MNALIISEGVLNLNFSSFEKETERVDGEKEEGV